MARCGRPPAAPSAAQLTLLPNTASGRQKLPGHIVQTYYRRPQWWRNARTVGVSLEMPALGKPKDLH